MENLEFNSNKKIKRLIVSLLTDFIDSGQRYQVIPWDFDKKLPLTVMTTAGGKNNRRLTTDFVNMYIRRYIPGGLNTVHAKSIDYDRVIIIYNPSLITKPELKRIIKRRFKKDPIEYQNPVS